MILVSIRGALSSMGMMYVSFGIIVGFTMSSYLSYYVMPCIAIALPVVYLLAIIGLSETPQFLLRQGRDALAEKSYYFYKNLSVLNPGNESAHHETAKIEFETFRQQVLNSEVRQRVKLTDFCEYII